MAILKPRLALWAIACLVAAVVVGAGSAAGSGGSGGRSSRSAEERALFDDLNARRRRAGRATLRWDAGSYDVLRDTARVWAGGGRTDSNDLNNEVTRRRGQHTAWLYRLRVRSSAAEAVADLLGEQELLDTEYSSVSVAVVESEDAGFHLAAAAAYLSRLVPYLPDGRGNLHWAPWFVQPWAPFNTTNPFLAWQWANERVRYDHPKAASDVAGWQTPQETQASETGVCRDTSVFLGAWLAHMGKDFRVVTGLVDDKDPHAWVVLFDGEASYLLETAMDGNMSRRYPPRLELATKYLPTEMMFDSRRVWLNRGQQRVRDYESPQVWAAATEEAAP
jgi:hypothetical protein